MRKKGENSFKCAGKSALPPDENNGFKVKTLDTQAMWP
jgi:hypothetical protein